MPSGPCSELIVAVVVLVFPTGLVAEQVKDDSKPPQERPLPAQQEKDPAKEDGNPPQEKPLPKELSEEPAAQEGSRLIVQADLRMGGWGTGSFDALTSGGRRRIDTSLLFDSGIDLRVEYSGWTLALTGDYGVGEAVRMQMGGILFGANWVLADEPLPVDLQVSAGPVFGRLEIDQSGFGHFKSAAGFEVRVSAIGWLRGNVGLSLWLDYRQISFKYDEPVVSGDTRTGGALFAFGAGLVIRF
ncbi:MAG TPA: cell envelope integrity protein TolA [Planctomycetota bacterium]|nr:cell envelope integrity protein TolA [Planctomycetota bacterium]